MTSKITFAQDQKTNFTDFIIGSWTCDVEVSLKHQQKQLKKPLPENLKQQIRDQLTGTKILIKEDVIEVLLLGKETKLSYKKYEIGPNYIKIKVDFPLWSTEKRTLIYQNDRLFVREASKTYLILVKEK